MNERIRGLRRLFRFPSTTAARARADIDDEIAFHLDARARDLVASGMAPDDADAQAAREFGDVEAARRSLGEEGARAARRGRAALVLADALADARLAIRGMRRAPSLAIVVALTLGLGIGANATMLGIVDRLLLRGPAGVVEAGRVVRVYGRNGWTALTRSWPDYLDLRDGVASLAAVAAYQSTDAIVRLPERTGVRVERVTASYLPLLGVRPLLGRFHAADEDRGRTRVAVVSERLWRGAMAADRSAVGRDILLDGDTYRVVGVAAAPFTGVDAAPADIWVPLGERAPDRGNYGAVHVIARLAPGRTLAAADREANRANRAGYRADGLDADDDKMQLGALAVTRGPAAPREVRIATLLAGVALLVLLAATANVANLLIARAMARTRETALRAALGAGRGRLARQQLMEGLCLGALGGAASLVVCAGMGPLLERFLLPAGAPGYAWHAPDLRLLAIVAVLALAVGAVCGAVGALHALAGAPAATLRGEGAVRAVVVPRRRRGVLLVTQVMCTMVLLVGAGLFVRSLSQVRALPLGFAADRLVVVRVGGSEARLSDTAAAALLGTLAERARRLPAVAGVSAVNTVPFLSAWRTRFHIAGRDPERWGADGGGRFNYLSSFVDTAYLATTGLQLLGGRWFAAEDGAAAPPVAVINDALARTVWPGAAVSSALGQCLQLITPGAPCTRVVGVVQAARVESLFDDAPAQYYLPLAQPRRDEGVTALIVRVVGDPSRAAATLQGELGRHVPRLVDVRATPLDDAIEPVRRPWELGAVTFALFGVLVLVVAATGIYGLAALTVAQRTAELGLRRALGATGPQVTRLVGVDVLVLVVVGLALGAGVGAAAARAGSSLLFGVQPLDGATYVAACGMLLLVAALSCVAPLRRALRVAPVVALRDAA